MVAVAGAWSATLDEIRVPDELQKKLRRADDFIRLGVIGAWNVLQGAGDSRTGLVLCSSYGPMETNFGVLDQVVMGNVVSPTLFSHSVFNAVSGYIATVCGASGALTTLTDFDLPFFRALQQGWLAVACGRLERCLVIQVETYSRLLLDAREKQCDWPPGVICWMLEKKGPLELIEPHFKRYGGDVQLLDSLETLDGEASCHPLSAAMLLTGKIVDGTVLPKSTVRSAVTEVELQLSKKI